MLNIAVCVKRFGLWGGKEIYAVEVARGLVRKGHRVTVFAYRADPDLLENLAFQAVPQRMAFSNLMSTLNFIAQTRRKIPGGAFDVVHSHERHYGTDLVTLHSFSYRSGMERYTGLRKIDQQYLSPRSLGYLWLEARQMRVPWLIAVSESIARDVRERYGRRERMCVIPPGVDTRRFHPDRVRARREEARRRLGIGPREPVVLFVGSAFQRKGLDRLIAAISEEMRLLVVGTGDHLRRYRAMAARRGLERRVSFLGFAADVRPCYAAADVVVLPSRSEAFGMSILEAMACGLPAIVSANSGVAGLIQDGINGFLMDSPETLGPLLRWLVAADRRRDVGRKARETAERYTWERITAAHEACYAQMVSERTAR